MSCPAIIYSLAIPFLLIAHASSAQTLIKVGVSTPLTGTFAAWGAPLKQGAELAASQINAAGKQKIELITVDDGCNPTTAVTAANKLVMQDNVLAIVGYPCTAAALAARTATAQSGTLLIVLSQSVPIGTDGNKNVLRLIGRDDRLAGFAADFLRAAYPSKKLGVRLLSTVPSFNLALRGALDKKGLKPVEVDEVAPSALEPPAWAGGVDVALTTSSLAAIKTLASTKPTLDIVVAIPVLDAALTQVLKETPKIFALTNPPPQFFGSAKDVIEEAEKRKLDSTGYFIYAYAAIQVAAELATRTGNKTSGGDLFKAATEKAISTAIGPLIFNSSGELSRWRFSVGSSSQTVMYTDPCQRQDCRNFEDCPPDCPAK